MNKFKKFLKYLLVPFALIGSIISIYSINTYAYDSTQFSYTLTYSYTNNDEFIYNLNEPIVYNGTPINLSEYIIIFNLDITNISRNTSYNGTISFNGGNFAGVPIYVPSSFNGDICTFFGYGSYNFNVYSNLTYVGLYIPSSISSYLLNVDFISRDELQIQPYVTSYMNNLQNQYNTLLSQYNTLNTSYTQLQSDYSSLSTNYTDLQTQYNQLQTSYNILDEDYDRLEEVYQITMNNYQNLQSDFATLQGLYNQLQTRYNTLLADYNRYVNSAFPFKSDFYTTRTLVLNGVSTDMGANTPNYNGVVWTQDDKLVISPIELDIYNGYVQGKNVGSVTFVSSDAHTFYSYSVVSLFSHGMDNFFNVSFYLNDKLVMSTINFDTDMGDGENTTTLVYPTTFNKFVVSFEWDTGTSTDDSYFYANQSTFANGYQYAYDEMNPIISSLRDDLEQANNTINNLPTIREEEYNRGKQDGIAIGSDENNTLYGMVIRTL